jgi:LysR family nitrogen assimilation transcriptional regulator
MDLRRLRYFLAVADSAGLSTAAAKANISQPALSRQMHLLEEELDVKLFERLPRGIRLTEAGMRLQQLAATLVRQAQNMRSELRGAAKEPSGNVILAVPPSLRHMITIPISTKFLSTYRDVTLTVLEGASRPMREALAEGAADVAVFSRGETVGRFEWQPLVTEALCLVGPRRAGLTLGRPVALEKIVDLPMVLAPLPNSLRRIVDRALARANLVCRPALQVESVSLMIDLINGGFGYTILPYCGIDRLLRTGRVSAARLKQLDISWVVATSGERRVTTAARTFADLIAGEAKRLVDTGEWKLARWNG